MKFLVEAQLPRRLARHLCAAGYDALHTLDLPLGNRTPDDALARLARDEDRVLVTKDGDFTGLYVLKGYPRLLVVGFGNCTNAELEALLLPRLPAVADALASNGCVRVTRTALVVHP